MSLIIAAIVGAGVLYCIFWWTQRLKQSATVSTEKSSHQVPFEAPTEAEIFEDPVLLAEWVKEHFLDGFPLSKDYDLLPSAENRAGLEITVEQRDRCLCEYSVLRLAGTSLLVKNHFDDVFWLKYTDQITRSLYDHIQQVLPVATHASIRSAVEEYVTAAHSGDGARVASLYMQRVYDDNPNYIRMLVSGIGRMAQEILISHNDIMLDAYCKVKYGMSYEALVAQGQAVREFEKQV